MEMPEPFREHFPFRRQLRRLELNRTGEKLGKERVFKLRRDVPALHGVKFVDTDELPADAYVGLGSDFPSLP